MVAEKLALVASEATGREFESLRAHHPLQISVRVDPSPSAAQGQDFACKLPRGCALLTLAKRLKFESLRTH